MHPRRPIPSSTATTPQGSFAHGKNGKARQVFVAATSHLSGPRLLNPSVFFRVFRGHKSKRPIACAFASILAAVGLTLPGAAEDPPSVPFPLDWERLEESVLDYSGRLDAPAGKNGFIRAEGARLRKPDGTRWRVWGMNICGPYCFPTKEQAIHLADDFARFGFNCIRFHHMDASWSVLFDKKLNHTRQLDPTAMDRLDFFIAALKKRGIYVNLNLNVGREYREGDEVPDHGFLGYGKSATYFNPRLLELQQEFARQLLTHRNPYTGNEYRHEPAVAVVEMVNENSVLEGWVNWRLEGEDVEHPGTWTKIPVRYAEALTARYNEWLTANRTPEQVAALRREAGVMETEPIPRLHPGQFAAASKDRFHTEAEFLIGLERAFFTGMDDLLRNELGVRSLVIGTADHNDGYGAYAHIVENARLAFVDGHGYWQHPSIGEVTVCRNDPMVNDPWDATITQFARTPMVDRPFTISETNHPFPHRFAFEGVPILTPYMLFHDWDGIWWFTWGPGRNSPSERGIPRNGWFQFSVDPVKVANLLACAPMWFRQDVRPAETTVIRSYSPDEIVEALRLDRKERPFFTPGFTRETPLMHATRFAVDGRPASIFPAAPPPDAIRSDTGQLAWLDAPGKRGVVTVDTPRSQAQIGFLGANAKPLPHLVPRVENEACALQLTSMDNRPIARTDRLLLSTTSWSGNDDMVWNEDGTTLTGWGAGPVHIEPVRGTITIRGLEDAREITVEPLSPLGAPTDRQWPARKENDTFVVEIGSPPATLALIQVLR